MTECSGLYLYRYASISFSSLKVAGVSKYMAVSAGEGLMVRSAGELSQGMIIKGLRKLTWGAVWTESEFYSKRNTRSERY